MNRDLLIQKTLENLSKLPDKNVQQVSDFAEFLLYKLDDTLLTEGIQKITSQSSVFTFLEPDVNYTKADVKELYK